MGRLSEHLMNVKADFLPVHIRRVHFTLLMGLASSFHIR